MDCVACIDETTTGPVSPKGYHLDGGQLSPPLTCYGEERAFAHADVVGETSPGGLPICGDS